MDRVALSVLGLSRGQSIGTSYTLILQEEDGSVRIPIIIGANEAQSIAIALEGLTTPRPLTHDLFVNLSNAYQIQMEEMEIYKLEEGIFYSRISFHHTLGNILIDARTSDAVALAIRFGAPIYISKEVLTKSGISFDDSEKSEAKSSEKIESKTEELENLNQKLNLAIKQEDYELAAQLKSEIARFKQDNNL